MESEKQLSAGEQKVLEYADRIRAGESKEEIFKDLPDSFKASIEEHLEAKTDSDQGVVETSENPRLPPQYEGLPLDIVEELWIIPVYADPEKTKSENERKQKVIAQLREEEQNRKFDDEKQAETQERISELKAELGIDNALQPEVNETDPYASFRLKNGETDVGAWWYEYRNQIAKEMKDAGAFEWGKERIYFDIPLSDMVRMKDLVMKIAKEEKLPIAFKHLDQEKTFDSVKDGTETRFVANFASADDVLRFYSAIRKRPEYQSFQSDRNMSYGGYRADGIAEYSNGYRESRDALSRIMSGAFNEQGEWEWEGSGRRMKIPKENYELFKKQFEALNEKLASVQKQWEDAFKEGNG
jgi:hypothetical protein